MSQLTADLLLILATLFWGTTFVTVKTTTSVMGVFTYLAVRFFIAGAVLLCWYWTPFRRWSTRGGSLERRFLWGSLLTGASLFFSYVFQTFGLTTVPAGKAAFITGLSVVMVPLASHWILRNPVNRGAAWGVALATLGLGLMSLQLPLQAEMGDLLVLVSAVGFATHILLVEAYAEAGDTVLFAAIQLLVVAFGSFVGALILERPLTVPDSAWGAIVFTALLATCFAFLIQSAVQRFTTATHTALIFSTEPVFGALFAYLLVGEVLTPKEIAGGACILGGMLLSELGIGSSRGIRTSRSMD